MSAIQKTLMALWIEARQNTSIFKQIGRDFSEKRGKSAVRKKIEKRLVLKNGIPIMRLHRHGGCESLHKQPGRLKRKILK
jgi:hypothetical protein